MICTLCPATTISQSSSFAVGINSRKASILSVFDSINCCTKYLVKPKFFAAEAIIVNTLFGFTDLIKSKLEPFFRNLGEKPAKGPKNNASFPSINRVSKCGTDIGGAPTAALPYTFAICSLTTSGFLQTKNKPLTGKPPICLLRFRLEERGVGNK